MVFGLLTPVSSFAASNTTPLTPAPTPSAVKIHNPIGATDVPTLVNNIVKVILGVVGALALAMFVYGGMMWMTSAGNDQRITKGKETLTWAVIGLLIIFSSYAILNTVFKAFSGS